MSNERILIVEDDDAIANGLALTLKLEGYDTVVCDDGGKALDQIQSCRPHLVLLDITLPNKNGLDVLGDLRELGDTTPVLVLSARQDEFDKVSALRLGADDYVTKPFSVAELTARIEAMLRRLHRPVEHVPVASPTNGFGKCVIDPKTREVRCEGELVSLTKIEFDLLVYFVQNPAQVFDRNHLMNEVWGIDHDGSPRTVDNFVGQLRQKLEVDPNQPRHFVTVRGAGYRFDP